MIIFIIILLVILAIIFIFPKKVIEGNAIKQNTTQENNNIDYSKFTTNNYVMTQTELKFYRELKKITDKLELTIFPQVDLERIIKVVDNNRSDRQRIKSRSIDYTVVESTKCKVICCIELDDYSHERESVKKVDAFKDNLFNKVNIPLYRVKVSSYYNLEELENKIKNLTYNKK